MNEDKTPNQEEQNNNQQVPSQQNPIQQDGATGPSEADLKKEKQHGDNKETAKVAIKAAETYFTGDGGAITDTLANTAIGQEVLDKAATVIDKSPVASKASEALNDSGMIDVADQAVGAMGGGGGAAAGAAGGAGKAAGGAGAGKAAAGATPKATTPGASPQGGAAPKVQQNAANKPNRGTSSEAAEVDGPADPDYYKRKSMENDQRQKADELEQKKIDDDARKEREAQQRQQQKEEVEQQQQEEAQDYAQQDEQDKKEKEKKDKKKDLLWTFIKANPLAAVGIISVLFLFVFFAMVILVIVLQGEGKGNSDNVPSGWSCSYIAGGVEYKDVEVELVNCNATESDYEVLETISLEKYALGVALAEAGESTPDDALKAQIIAVRNFAFTRNKTMCGSDPDNCFFGYNATTNKIRMRACTNDQVYWDYLDDSYRVEGSVALYSPEVLANTPGAKLWKKALSDFRRSEVEALASDVAGKFLLDSSGNFVATNYTSVETNQFIALAKQGDDYTEILLKVYGTQNTVGSATCEYSAGLGAAASGDYANWNQYDPAWASTRIGTCTLGRVGCMITSIAIQIARSGAQTNLAVFNPGTFAAALNNNGGVALNCNYMGINYVKKIVPTASEASSESIYGQSKSQILSYLKNKIASGCYMVLEVKGYGTASQVGQHWVAVDDVSTTNSGFTKLFMWDPGSQNTDLFGTYGNRVTKAKCFKF